MWQNLTDATKQRIADAGPAPQVGIIHTLWNSDPDHAALFTEYFQDNCEDQNDLNCWDCFLWLRTKDLDYFTRSESRYAVLDKFEEAYGPHGAMHIDWPSDVTSWFDTRDKLNDAEEGLYKEEYEDSDWVDDHRDDAQFQEWSAASDAGREWRGSNSYPLDKIQAHLGTRVKEWYDAYFDEIARMNAVAMPAFELDRDYIDSINKVNLDRLGPGDGVACIGYGYYVLMGEFSPGYLKAVASYDKHWEGALTMVQRGTTFSAGKVQVSGCEGEDQKWFKEAFRRVSKKAIEFT